MSGDIHPEFTVEYRVCDTDTMVWKGPFMAFFISETDDSVESEGLVETAVSAAKDDAIAHHDVPLMDADDLVDVRTATVKRVE